MPTVTYPIAPDGIFLSRQGEGHLTGTSMIFVRLAGCDLASVCGSLCDTDFSVAQRLSTLGVVDEVVKLQRTGVTWVWITGGEPTNHNLTPLLQNFHALGFKTAVATHGEHPLTDPVDWVSVTPKRPGRLRQTFGHEIKIVPGLGHPIEQTKMIVRDAQNADFWFRYVQPLMHDSGYIDPGSKAECDRILSVFPSWNPSVQMHKEWGLP